MTRDYKPTPQKQKATGKGSPFFSGMLIGLLLGIGASVGVALFVKGGESPFVAKVEPAPTEPSINSLNSAAPENAATKPDAKAPVKSRFDFYTILPGTEKQVTEQEIKASLSAKQEADKAASESYYLQVGAFQTEGEADNMKAKLALLGLEAVIQTANIPDKGVWHRVRVGPFTQIDDINKARTELAKNGIDSALLKIHSSIPDQ